MPLRTIYVFLFALLLNVSGATFLHADSAGDPPTLTYRVIARYAHDPALFTQGLELHDGVLYESSGLYGQSFIARHAEPFVNVNNAAAPMVHQALPTRYFGEGLTLWNEHIYVVTWREQQGFIFDRQSLQKTAEFHFTGEGWGLAHNAHQLILSNGSATLQFIDPNNFTVVKSLRVHNNAVAVDNLNELEWVDAKALGPARVLANIWQTDLIAVIDPDDGRVTALLDLSQLYPRGQRSGRADVLNGIAFDARDNTLLITGKFWPYLYRLQLLRPLP